MAFARSHIWLVRRVCRATVEQIIRICARMRPQDDTHTDIRLDGSIFDGCHARNTILEMYVIFGVRCMRRVEYIIFWQTMQSGFVVSVLLKKCQNRNIAQNAVVLLSMPHIGSTDSTLTAAAEAAMVAFVGFVYFG